MTCGCRCRGPASPRRASSRHPSPPRGAPSSPTRPLSCRARVAASGATDAAELLARRESAFADVQEHYYDEPPVMVRGWREHLIDADGRVYLDTLNNVTSIGHAHPRLVDAVAEQWRLLNTNSRFHYPAVVEFSERLAALAPDPLDTVFLVNSGSEAVDLALRLGQAWSGRRDVLAVQEAYHGWTYLTDAVSTSIADNPAALETRPAWVHTVPAPNPFRGAHTGADAGGYARDAAAEIERLAAAGTPVGAFIAEAVFGNAGGLALPDGYLDAVYRAVRAHGGLAIADEVQVGYGRLGEWFWGFEQQGVVPDVIAVAKAMGNGHPLGAVITTRQIAERYRAGGYFFSSAGGSPVSSVVGLDGARHHPRRAAAAERARDRRLSQGTPRGARPTASDPRRRARFGVLPRTRVRTRPRHVGARDGRDGRDLLAPARAGRDRAAHRRPPEHPEDQAADVLHPRERRRARDRAGPGSDDRLVTLVRAGVLGSIASSCTHVHDEGVTP